MFVRPWKCINIIESRWKLADETKWDESLFVDNLGSKIYSIEYFLSINNVILSSIQLLHFICPTASYQSKPTKESYFGSRFNLKASFLDRCYHHMLLLRCVSVNIISQGLTYASSFLLINVHLFSCNSI